jgi:hypothetical protein
MHDAVSFLGRDRAGFPRSIRVVAALASVSVVSCGGTNTTASTTDGGASSVDGAGTDASFADATHATETGATDASETGASDAVGEGASDAIGDASGDAGDAPEAEAAATSQLCLARASKGVPVPCPPGGGCDFDVASGEAVCVGDAGPGPEAMACGTIECLEPYCYCIDLDNSICDCLEAGAGPLPPPDLPRA